MVDRPQIDISEERYDGPSATIAALGRGVVQHLVWAMYGVVAFGAAAFLMPETAERILNASRNLACRLKNLPEDGIMNRAQHGFGSFVHGIFGEGEGKLGAPRMPNTKHQQWLDHSIIHKEHGFGHWLMSHTFGMLPFVGKDICSWLEKAGNATATTRQKRITNALTFGGAFGAAGYLGGWLEAIFHGSRHGNDGRRQLEAAQDALKKEYTTSDALAAQNTKLAEENAALKAKLSHEPRPAPVAKETLASRDPVKAPEHDWADTVKAQREETAHHEATIH